MIYYCIALINTLLMHYKFIVIVKQYLPAWTLNNVWTYTD